MAKYAQKILFFFCRPRGDYHEKTHPHYRSMKTQDEAPETQNRTTMRRSDRANRMRESGVASSAEPGCSALGFQIADRERSDFV